MWRSVYLHESPGDYNALPGSILAGSIQAAPLSFPPGQQFLYKFAHEIDEVVGYSARIRIHRPVAHWGVTQRILFSGTDIELRLGNTGQIFSGTSQPADAFLRVAGGAAFKLGTLHFPHREFIDIRVDWHTSGQARLLQNGKLVGYHNAVSPGALLSIPDVTLGRIDEAPARGAAYRISRVFVRVLKRADNLALLSALLPTSEVNNSKELDRCRYLAIQELLTVAAQLRPFMAKFHQHESIPWSNEDSPNSNPFSSDSTNAHQFAVAAGNALVRILRTRDFSNTDAFIIPFDKFLQILHSSLPMEFEALAKAILESKGLSEQCIESLQRDKKDNGEEFDSIIKMINQASESLLKIAGVN